MAAKSYYVYRLQASLIDTLSPLTVEEQIDATFSIPVQSASESVTESLSTNRSCTFCGEIKDVGDIRSHYKSDFHRFNVKRKLQNQPTVNEEQFEALIDVLQDTESISGSDSDSETSDTEGETELATLMSNTSVSNDILYEEDEGTAVPAHLRGSPYALFVSDQFPDQCLAVYKPILDPKLIQDDPVQSLRELPVNGHSVVLMIGGGHFSSAVISHTPSKHQPSPQNPYASIDVLAHKTFHRYTTRRKQGGSQSASDNAHGKANSAGSSLRRANEAALQVEIRELLESWRDYISTAAAIYIRASGRSNRNVLLNYEKSPIVSTDSRLRTLPFTTKRATGAEIKRAWQELTTARLINKPEPEPVKKKHASAVNSAPSSRAQSPKPSKRTPTAEEKHTEEITSLIKRSRSPRLIAYMRSNGLDPNFALQPFSHYQSTPTPVFYAASQGSHHVVGVLLTTLKADPTIRNVAGRTAFQLSADQATKDAFQLARSALGEHTWDWKAAKVGPALTKEDIQQREEQEQQALAEQRQQDLKKLHNDNASDNRIPSQASKLAANIATSVGQEAALRGLSEDAKKKLEREMRARAAEARFKRLG